MTEQKPDAGKDIESTDSTTTPPEPDEVVAGRGLGVVSDDSALTDSVDRAIAANPDVAEKIRGGKTNAVGALIGAVMKVPAAVRWNMTAILLVAVMVAHVVLPDGHPFRAATGGDIRLWAILLGFGVLVWLYRRLLGMIRARVARMSVTGEAGYEINCRYGDHVALRRMLLEAGAVVGVHAVDDDGRTHTLTSDAVVLATGGRVARPDVPGIDSPRVCTFQDVLWCQVEKCEFYPSDRRPPVECGPTALVWGDHFAAADTAEQGGEADTKLPDMPASNSVCQNL